MEKILNLEWGYLIKTEVKHGMCGNGIRCLAKYLYEYNFTKDKSFIIETISGNKEIELIAQIGETITISPTVSKQYNYINIKL